MKILKFIGVVGAVSLTAAAVMLCNTVNSYSADSETAEQIIEAAPETDAEPIIIYIHSEPETEELQTVAEPAETEPEYPNEYTELFLTMDAEDWDLLARCVMCEAGGSNEAVAEATCCAILNRALPTNTNWPNSVKEVVTQRGQFTTQSQYYKVEPNGLTYEAIAAVRQHGAQVIRDELAAQGWDFASTDYDCFATKKQSIARDHIFIGLRNESGKPIKWQYHYLGILKSL